MKRIINTGKILTVAVIVLLLGACILQPETERTGSITIGFGAAGVSGSGISAAAIPDGATDVRIWLYLNGSQLRTTEAALRSGGTTVRIEDVPISDGYTLVVVLGEKSENVFTPLGFARSAAFSVSGGPDTPVRVTTRDVNSDYSLIGKNLNSVVRVGSDVFASTGDAVFLGDNNTGLNGTINSITPGLRPDGNPTVFANMNDGIRYWNGSVFVQIDPDDPPVMNIQNSGAFIADDAELEDEELVIYYSRLGGLGGVTTSVAESTPVWDWGDSGDEMEDLIAPDQNPIRAMATDGSNAAYISSVLGTFKMTRDFLSDENNDLDIGGLLGGDSDDAQGLTFFGVAYPGTDRPMRIARIGLVKKADIDAENNRIFVGTGRGAFYFSGNRVDDDGGLTNTGLIQPSFVNRINVRGIRDQAVLDISVSGNRVAIATRETIAVVDALDPNDVVFSIPSRAVSLGAPRNVFLYNDEGTTTLYVAGEQGLTILVVETP